MGRDPGAVTEMAVDVVNAPVLLQIALQLDSPRNFWAVKSWDALTTATLAFARALLPVLLAPTTRIAISDDVTLGLL